MTGCSQRSLTRLGLRVLTPALVWAATVHALAFAGSSAATKPAASASMNASADTTAHRSVGAHRIVSLNGQITEILFALGAGPQVVGVDLSSTYPPEAQKLPKVGYQRTLSSEGVLALEPELVVGNDEAGPPNVIEALRATRTRVAIVTGASGVDSARARIREVAAVLGQRSRGEALVSKLDRELADAQQRVAKAHSTPSVLFVFARGAGSVFVSGRGTPADDIIRLAGGHNAVTGFDGFKPLTAEAAAASGADVIVVPDGSLESLGGIDALLALPGLSMTPAGRDKRVVHLDTQYLLGFGPRCGMAVSDLASALHPELAPTRP